MIRQLLKTAAVITVLLPTSANAMFVTNYGKWKEMPVDIQVGFVMGVMDAWTRTSTKGDADSLRLQRIGINDCMKAQKITSGMLVEQVDAHYKAYQADWRMPPASVLKHVVMDICLANVNTLRKEAGLQPWERAAKQISKDE